MWVIHWLTSSFSNLIIPMKFPEENVIPRDVLPPYATNAGIVITDKYNVVLFIPVFDS